MNEAVTCYCPNEECGMHGRGQIRWWNHRHPKTGEYGSWWVSNGRCVECKTTVLTEEALAKRKARLEAATKRTKEEVERDRQIARTLQSARGGAW